MTSQADKVLELLEASDWVCTSDMYRLYMADPRRRLCDLRDAGHQLKSRKCQQHLYHKGGSKEWKLVDGVYVAPAPVVVAKKTMKIQMVERDGMMIAVETYV